MKSGPHKTNKLTAMTVKRMVKQGRHGDGNGLYLIVEKSGSKRWVFRSTMRGRRTDMGLGSVNLVPLAEAREKAIVYKKEASPRFSPWMTTSGLRIRESCFARTTSPEAEQAPDADTL